jgi:hypothetical protein
MSGQSRLWKFPGRRILRLRLGGREKLVIDLYTKAVLTVIAVALCAIAIRGPTLTPAIAQTAGMACGHLSRQPCYVEVVGTAEVSGSVDVTGRVAVYNKVAIDTGLFGLPVQMTGR